MSNTSGPADKRPSFLDFCTSFGWEANDTSTDPLFVGVKIERDQTGKLGEPRFVFPHGYPEPAIDGSADKKQQDKVDQELKSDFFRLLRLIDEVKKRDSEEKLPKEEQEELDFPINAFLSVLRYFLDYGYFMEAETVYKKGLFGKVSWTRTIKRIKPQVVKDAEGRRHVVYLDLISRLTRHKEDNLITLVHKYCVYKAVQFVGPLLGVSEAGLDKPELEFDYNLFSEVVKEKISTTFNDRLLELFQALNEIIEYLNEDEKKSGANEGAAELRYGVKSFALIWERIVNRIFGTVDDKDDYQPHCEWKLLDKEKPIPMFPDTIMQEDSSVFILDAKYYTYGVSPEDQEGSLPGSDSICKQIAYAEFVELHASRFFKTTQGAGSHIYNAFILPFCAASCAKLPGENVNWAPFTARFMGSCHGNWKNLEPNTNRCGQKYRPYHKIACVLLDMKSAMQNCSPNLAARTALAKMIREATE